MLKSYYKLPTQAALLSALLLVLLPASAKAELTDEQIAEAVCNGIFMWASQISLDGFVPINLPIDENYAPLSLAIKDGLLDGNTSRIAQIYQLLLQRQFTNELGQVLYAIDSQTLRLSDGVDTIDLYLPHIDSVVDGIDTKFYDVLHYNGGGNALDVYVDNLSDVTDAIYWQNSEQSYAYGSILASLDSILASLDAFIPTNRVDISSDEVSYTDEFDFIDTTASLAEVPYDDTSYSDPTNTDHFAGIGNPTLLDLPDPTSKLTDLSTSVQNLPQNDEIVFWDAESGTSADALGKVSVRLGEQGMVQTSGNVFVFAWDLLYAIFSGMAIWKFVVAVHPTANQMQGTLF